MTTMPEICITASDRRLLGSLLADAGPIASWEVVEFLVRTLLRATVVGDAEVPPDLVTMGSTVILRTAGEEEQVVTLLYPQHCGTSPGDVSVLSPLGAGLLGASVGEAIAYPLDGGGSAIAEIVDVIFQPQAMRRVSLSAARVGPLAGAVVRH